MGETMVIARHFADGMARSERYVYWSGDEDKAAAYAITRAAMSFYERTGCGPVIVAPMPDIPSLGYRKEPMALLIQEAELMLGGYIEFHDIFIAREADKTEDGDGAVIHRNVVEFDVTEPSRFWTQSFEQPIMAVGYCTRKDFDDALDALIVKRANEVLGRLPNGGDRVVDVMRIDRVLHNELEG